MPSGVLGQQDPGKSGQKRQICPFENSFQNRFCVFAVTLNLLDSSSCETQQWPLNTPPALQSPLRFQFSQFAERSLISQPRRSYLTISGRGPQTEQK